MRLVVLVVATVTLGACRGAPAARDAAVSALDPPRPRAPAHGAMVAAGAPLRFAWEPAAGPAATTYQLQLDDGCAGRPMSACAPSRPDVDVVVTGAAWQPDQLPAGRWTWRVRACRASVCSPWSRPRRVDVGRAAGDIDGDGFSDVIAGAPLLDGAAGGGGRDRGAALVVFGGGSGARDAVARTARLDEPGGNDDAELGAALAIVGDVDGDGFADVVVGAPGTDEGRGRAYLYLGTAGGVRGPVLTISDPGGRAGDWLGAAVIGAGDVDGDGFADVAIAAPGADGDGDDEVDRGKVLVWLGGRSPLTGVPQTLSAGAPRPHDGFGSTLSAGDLDGDGYGDLVVGAAGIDRAGTQLGIDRGAVYVFAGGRDGLSRSPRARLEAPSPVDHDRFGYAVSASGDLDGDGLADLAIGAPSRDDGAEDGGAVYVFAGDRAGVGRTPRDVVTSGAVRFARLGTAVAIVGDVDGDGIDDLAVGTSAPGGGVATILRGGALTGAPLAILRDRSAGDTDFGDSVAGAGDVDGDRLADVVVGAAGAPNAAGAAAGSVLVFRAIAAASPPAPVRIDGPSEPAQLGRAVAGR